jgi:5-methylcytosine-specific restriction enzyme B
MAGRLPFPQAAVKWDRAAAQSALKDAEKIRAEILSKFPMDSWADLPLNRYALGTDQPQGSWCWWMEFNSQELGSMRGGAAQKHLIFRRKADGSWWYLSKRYANEDEAWKAIRAGYLQAFELAKAGRFPEIDTIESIEGGYAIRTKTLYVYFPNDLLPIYSTAHLANFIEMFGGDVGDRGVIAANRYLREILLAKPEFKGWSGWEIMQFLYWWADPRGTLHIVKIAPGEQARYWQQCMEGGFICVGWPKVGDLRQYASREDFQAQFMSTYGPEYGRGVANASKKAGELWKLMELSPGDIVIANKGTAQVVGIGTVVEPGYTWREDVDGFPHTVSVHWDDTTQRTIDPVKSWANATVARVSGDLYEKIRSATKLPPPTPPVEAPDDLWLEIQSALTKRRQVILYGPPGTGKTRAALEFADWWLAESKKVTQVTFHPSYSYEDFVEGYRPKKDAGAGLALELRDGVFKELCGRAAADKDHKYLLIIDEINRGNVPKVFGELITLLELDKRGKSVTLPQSGDSFVVPDNLYVIGTMNTADRSIRVLDAALRRRFAFIELMPDPSLLEGEGPEGLKMNDLLTHLNARIAKAVGREKQIGHSYFLEGSSVIKDGTEFARRFRQEVLPLLQEYCYDDYSKLAEFIGPDIVDVEAQAVDSEVISDPARLIEALNKLIAD